MIDRKRLRCASLVALFVVGVAVMFAPGGSRAAGELQDEPKVKSLKEVEGSGLLAEMEETLLRAPAIRVKETATANGAVVATFRDTIDLAQGNLLAVGSAVILRGRGGDPLSRAAGSGKLQ